MAEIKALIDGVWHDRLQYSPALRARLANGAAGGFRDRVAAGGGDYPARPGRYHLYVSYACPWAHRTLIYRSLKRLEQTVSLSVLHPRWAGPGGWRFGETEFSTVDHPGGREFLHQVYQAARPDFTGRVTVPVLWDRQRETIVNNESSDIMRMFNSAFDAWGEASVDFYPRPLRSAIDALNAWLVPNVCQGVYRAGFALDQAAYESALQRLFDSLDELEARLARQTYLLGKRITESDWHLFTTLCRFDAAYVGALKCNLRRLVDYPALSAYARHLHRLPGVAQTVRVEQIKLHYYDAIGEINPAIVPAGPALDYSTGPDLASAEVFRREVIAMHAYLEAWLKGRVEASAAATGPGRLHRALAEDFSIVHPNGARDDKPAVIGNFTAAYASKGNGYALEIGELSVRMLDPHLCLASYRETHRGEPGRSRISSRISSALLKRIAGGRIEWISLHETALQPVHAAADRGAAGS